MKFFEAHSERLTFSNELLLTYSAAKRGQNQTAHAAKPQGGISGARALGYRPCVWAFPARLRQPAIPSVLQ
jgi:hypothetical protein